MTGLKRKITVLAAVMTLPLYSCGNVLENGDMPVHTETSYTTAAPVTEAPPETTTVTAQTEAESKTEKTSQTTKKAKVTTSATTTTAAETTAAPEQDPDAYPHYRSITVYCVEDVNYIFTDNPDERCAPGSITKLLTASVALHNLSPDTVLTVGTEQELVHPGSSVCGIQQGQQAKLSDLITGMLMPSGSDAAYTVAVSTARALCPDKELSDTEAIDLFCEKMNEFAAGIGMTNTHFINPEGWDDPNHYTTASDLTVLAQYAINVPEIRAVTSSSTATVTFETGETFNWKSTNYFLHPYSRFYDERSIGMKTGTTLSAGNCFVGAFVIDGKTYITTVLGCYSDVDRFEITARLLREKIK